MNILVVYAHHEPKSLVGSLKNLGISKLQEMGHQVVESDLYGIGFHPVANVYDFQTLSGGHFNYMLEQKYATENSWSYSPDVLEQMQRLQAADLVIFYTPIWWSSVPAILKGWFDRVLTMGFAWDSGKIYEDGLLRGKKVLFVGTAASPEEFYQPLGKYRATLRQVLHPILHGTLAFCGMDILDPFFVFSSMNKTPEEYSAILDSHAQAIELAVNNPHYLSKF
ncbi:NAD(P)H-dependent oxidoreductase [Candidatus Saccharibacteria bacterium]|nr:NAD(P)H-dependent oxidoreductase [Candidatus Saccharibacteria bacterium]